MYRDLGSVPSTRGERGGTGEESRRWRKGVRKKRKVNIFCDLKNYSYGNI